MKSILFLVSFLFALSGAAQTMEDICPLKNSTVIPSCEVFDIADKQLDLAEYTADKNVVLVFFRGGWCSYCSRQLAELKEKVGAIEALGYEVIAISPDSPANLAAANEYNFTLLSDKSAAAIEAFGLAWHVDDENYVKYRDEYDVDLEFWSENKHHLLPVPAVYVVHNAEVVFNYVNPKYSDRLSADLLVDILASYQN